MRKLLAVLVVALGMVVMPSASAAAEVIFDYIPSPLPGNVASYSYESWGVAEAGDGIEFSTNGVQTLDNAKVVVSSWACEIGTGWASENTVPCVTVPGSTFSIPITLNIYDPNDEMALVDSTTQTFNIPFRPSTNPECPETVNGQGWGDDCFLGLAHVITFDLTGVVVPDEIVYGVAWNTSDYGYDPIGDGAECAAIQYAGCPYDLLNLGVEGTAPSVGTDASPDGAWQYSVFASAYCDGGEGGTAVFRLDDGCWTGFNPLVQFNRFVAGGAGGGGGGGTPPPPPSAPTGPCTITGTAGPDQLVGTRGDDVICGRAGDDVIRARGGNDLVRAGGGNDRVRGGRGDDFLRGAAGDDFLHGGIGFDTCKGGRGVDTIRKCEA
jgi:hemolysin type calcium-binding protein